MKKSLLTTLVCLCLVGCAHIQALNPWHQSEWDATLSRSRQAVEEGNYSVADKLLDEYIRTHPGTRQAREIMFWKAAYEVDPANSEGSLASGIAALDGYLGANPDGLYKDEATVLRRTAAAAEGIANRAHTAATDTTPQPVVKDTVIIANKSRDEQIAALKDQLAASKAELAKVSAELDRIKKRLANPSN
jgi:hypothetical protein